MRLFVLPLLTLALALPVFAGDGVLEINQACAVNTGCFSGDTLGFPVTIDGSAGRSYRLTGDLVVPDENTDGIFVTADLVTIDLGGFGIRGPVTCNGSTGAVICDPAGTGIGIHAHATAPPPTSADHTTIRNGFVVGMGANGILVRRGALVDSVIVHQCASTAILAEDDSLITRSRVLLNGAGILAPSGHVSIQGNRIADSGGSTVSGVTEIGGNTCDDGRCSAVPKQRYYRTTAAFNGADADNPGNCAAGFHFASLWEIFDTSALRYDTSLGTTAADSGQGPPSQDEGWIRTGNNSSATNAAGLGNCLAWTSSSATDLGSKAFLPGPWASPGLQSSPWGSVPRSCSTFGRIWCVED